MRWPFLVRVALVLAVTGCRQSGTGEPPSRDVSPREPALPRPPQDPVAPVAPRPPETPVPPEPATPPDSPAPAADPPRPSPPPCTAIERGKEQRKHDMLGKTLAELEASGGEISCGSGTTWQLHFGTFCADLATFHDVVTVEIQGGRVRRVWTREEHNDGWCGEPSF